MFIASILFSNAFILIFFCNHKNFHGTGSKAITFTPSQAPGQRECNTKLMSSYSCNPQYQLPVEAFMPLVVSK
tara:strand:- start:209 stop:427 length:219 start_codon:yes stop_codon:yes gene_type:complete